MKKRILGLVLLQLTWLTGCVTMKPALDSGKIYEDSGSVMQKIGDNNCHLLIGTEHYGVFDTHTLPIEKCEKYRPGTKLQIRIYNAYEIEILAIPGEGIIETVGTAYRRSGYRVRDIAEMGKSFEYCPHG